MHPETQRDATTKVADLFGKPEQPPEPAPEAEGAEEAGEERAEEEGKDEVEEERAEEEGKDESGEEPPSDPADVHG